MFESGAGGTRTHDISLRRQAFYPPELQRQKGFSPFNLQILTRFSFRLPPLLPLGFREKDFLIRTHTATGNATVKEVLLEHFTERERC